MMKKLKCALLLLLTFCLLLTGCGQKTTPPDNGDETQNEDGGNNTEDNIFENEDATSPRPNVLQYYLNVGSVVKLKVNTILDGFYTRNHGSRKTVYVILEGIVIEDCYGKIDRDTVVRIEIQLSHLDENIDLDAFEENAFVKLLREFEYFYVWFYNGPFPRRKIYSVNKKDFEYIESVAEGGFINDYEIIPISDGKVNFDRIDKYLDGYQKWIYPRRSDIVGFDDWFYDGQTEEEFEKNIKKLSDSRNDK